MNPSIHAGYLEDLYVPSKLKRHVNLAAKRLKKIKFDTIAVTGNSGTIFGGALSIAMKKPLMLVRKDSDDTHSMCRVEGPRKIGRFVFVDDVVASGVTLRRVVKRLTKPEEAMLEPGTLEGVYLWRKLPTYAALPNKSGYYTPEDPDMSAFIR